VARLPGDQFAVLFSGTGPMRDIKRFTDGLRLAIAKPFNINNRKSS
jgi:GGDEF domain-containing protein